MLHLGAELLEKLLAVDTGYRGPRIDCGQGHHAEFVSYRVKRLETVLGPHHPAPRLLPLPRLWPRDRAARRRARRNRCVTVAGTAQDDRAGRRRATVRQGDGPA